MAIIKAKMFQETGKGNSRGLFHHRDLLKSAEKRDGNERLNSVVPHWNMLRVFLTGHMSCISHGHESLL